jgi:hypothetical protein
MLPDMIGTTENGVNVLYWTSQYDGIKSIAVQRSSDSVMNFATIGYVKSLKKGEQTFTDEHPMPGDNYYQLTIVFNSNLNWNSNIYKLTVDSAEILKARSAAVPVRDTTVNFTNRPQPVAGAQPGASTPAPETGNGTEKGKIAVNNTNPAKPKPEAPKPSLPAPKKEPDVDPSHYLKSQYVFSNPFTGHVNIEIPDAQAHVYSIQFFDSKNRKILEVPKIPAAAIVMDKRNFQHKGTYRFELMRNKEKVETGYVTIY